MSDLDVQLPSAFDPFAEANAEDSSAGAGSKDYVHVRVQQRNGRKSLTTVQGLKKEYSYNKILKDLKKEFCCNGTVVQDSELGQVQCCNHILLIKFPWCKCVYTDERSAIFSGHSTPR
ncbi:hypothetical protein BRADI_2g52330v3 [Brachypodium distachyon]|uniref:SUI1 domain-containing protein n=1 Tax=Brachypodium distachyon TaxID=15368 RepID=A0A0Q3N0T3_BRADI|nr:hypothetical protein BRADI_2g52330v3 [Brachypodium distachyon]